MSLEVFHITVNKGDSTTYGMSLLGSGPSIVSDVNPEGPAARAGVKPGFVVLEINDKNVTQKGHEEVKEILRSAKLIHFKFSPLETACSFFGDDLRKTFESRLNNKKLHSTGPKQKGPSPRKSDGKPSSSGGKRNSLDSRDDAKENGSNYHSVAVQAGGIDITDEGPRWLPARSTLISTPPRIVRPKPTRNRNASEGFRASNVQETRNLTEWMRSDQQVFSSPNGPRSPATPSSNTWEFICRYYTNLVDLLGPVEESVFAKNVNYMKTYKPPPQFWARMVFTDKRLTIYRPEGKYATYSPKHMRDVFIHEDQLFFGFSTVRSSKVQTPSNNIGVAQTMDVFSCHILFVDPTVTSSKQQQREIQMSLLAKSAARATCLQTTCFPKSAIEIVPLLKTLMSNSESPENAMLGGTPFTSTVSPVVEDVAASLNNANVLRSSMRKYGPLIGLQQRHSISSESLIAIPKRVSMIQPSRNSYIGTNLPPTISENEIFGSVDSAQSDTSGSLSSWGMSGRAAGSSFELRLPAHEVSSFDEFTPTRNQSQTCLDHGKTDLFQVLNNARGLNIFQAFLTQEHSVENLNFWQACQDYRLIKKSKEMRNSASKIYTRFLADRAPDAINVDSSTRKAIQTNLPLASTSIFDGAAKQVLDLMNQDSFPRFLKSPYYMQLRQLTEASDVNQSMPCLGKKDSNNTPRHSGLFSWMSKKKTDPDLDTSRLSLPGFSITSPDRQSIGSSSAKNPLKKLIDKGRKSFSARVKPTRRESLMNIVSDGSPPVNGGPVRLGVSPIPFEFRRPLTPPPKSEIVLRRPAKPRSAGKDSKRLSLQGFQRSKNKESTTSTEWTFSRNSLDNLDVVGVQRNVSQARVDVLDSGDFIRKPR